MFFTLFFRCIFTTISQLKFFRWLCQLCLANIHYITTLLCSILCLAYIHNIAIYCVWIIFTILLQYSAIYCVWPTLTISLPAKCTLLDAPNGVIGQIQVPGDDEAILCDDEEDGGDDDGD